MTDKFGTQFKFGVAAGTTQDDVFEHQWDLVGRSRWNFKFSQDGISYADFVNVHLPAFGELVTEGLTEPGATQNGVETQVIQSYLLPKVWSTDVLLVQAASRVQGLIDDPDGDGTSQA